MGPISCHSNKSSYPTGIKKNIIYVEANVHIVIIPSYSFIHLTVSEKILFYLFAKKNPFLWPWQPIKFSDLDKSLMKCRELLNKHFCKKNPTIPIETEINVNFHFSHY